MATFVVTGFNRTRSKCYRPSYTSDLDPIYEDNVTLPNRGSAPCSEGPHRDYIATVFQAQTFHRDSDSTQGAFTNIVYNWDSSDSQETKPVRKYTRNPQASQTSVSMLNGIMSSRFQCKRSAVSSTTPGTDTDIDIPDNNNVTYIKPGEKMKMEVSRTTSLYRADPVLVGRGAGITPRSDPPEPARKASKWYKLEPGTSIPRRLLCKSDGKYKRPCFAVCFVLLVVVIGAFIVVSIEGWTYTATGRGFTGDKPILEKYPPVFAMAPTNFTDIRDDYTDNLDYMDNV